MSNKKTFHLRTDVKDKKPSSGILDHGAIAINYNNESPTIFIKDTADSIVEFKDKKYFENIIEENELVVATALTSIKNSVGLGEDGSYAPQNGNIINNASTISEATILLDNAISGLNDTVNDLTDDISEKQEKLISGTNIKTINNTSLLGSGNIEIEIPKDVKVTSVENHYLPSEDSNAELNASSNTLIDITNSTDGVQVVTGLMRDAAGHVVGLKSTSLTSTNDKTLINITYSELVSLKNGSQLQPGCWYRITDYITTTSQENTISTVHQFDVLVLATDVNVLSEEARTIKHEGDTYFDNSNLNAWKIWYCLDNDSNRFGWSDASNGKGVIYRLIDEYGNDCPYDFKNIKFIPYTGSTSGSGGSGGASNISVGDFDTNVTDISNDEMNEELTELLNVSEMTYYYTFDLNAESDYSMGSNCYNNIIKPYYADGIMSLNFITFKNTSDEAECHLNSFGYDCYGNSFGNNCCNNSFGNNCISNSFGDNCDYNSFGDNCISNSFGNNCISNSFGDGYTSNSFGNNCISNSFGDGCTSNSFGNNCDYNSFGNNCCSNSFGNNCISNSFGNNCISNSFRMNSSNDSEVRSYCRNNIMENSVSYVILYNTSTASDSYNFQNVTVCQGMSGTSTSYNNVEIPSLNVEYQIKVAKNSKGDIKVYCEADLIQ